MKKLLYILLFVPLALFGQEDDPCYSVNEFVETTNSNNPPITLDLLSGWNMMGFSCVNEGGVDEMLSPISDKIVIVKNNSGAVYMPEWGFNGIGNFMPNKGYQIKMNETVIDFELCTNPIPFHQVDGCTDCEAINFNRWATSDDGSCQYNTCTDPQADNYQEVLPCIYYGCNDPLAANYDPYANTDDGSCVVAEACPYDNYLEYSPDAISYNANLCVNIIVEGCTDNTALNYNSDANVDDNSCEFIYGCIDQEADNYNVEATTDDGSCIYYGCMDPTAGNYDETANTDDGTCLIGGCVNPTAENYNPDAEVDDGSCVIYGCLLSDFPNYNSVANTDDGSCDMNSLDVFGCTDELTLTYQDFATIDNGICYYGPLPEIGDLILGGIVFYIDETGQRGLVSALEDLGQFEWGCFGTNISGADGQAIGTGLQNTLEIVAGCSETPIAASEALAYESEGYSDWFLPSKDELVEMYNTIGNGGLEGDIGGFETSNYPNYWSSSEEGSYGAWLVESLDGDSYPSNVSARSVRAIRAFGYNQGCMDEAACNYNPEANMADGSCEYAEQYYDCEGNITEYVVGMEAEGGIVYYIDETGQHGLVAALEDLPDLLEWGCAGTNIPGANDPSIGAGYQNTLDIVAACNQTPIAASESLAYESEGYTDWYLPSKDELVEMYIAIGPSSGFELGFVTSTYWASNEHGTYPDEADYVPFFTGGGGTVIPAKYFPRPVRPIRSF